MSEEKKYTETEFRQRVSEVTTVYCHLVKRYEQRNSCRCKAHELREVIAKAKRLVPLEIQDHFFKTCIEGLEEKINQGL